MVIHQIYQLFIFLIFKNVKFGGFSNLLGIAKFLKDDKDSQ